MTDVSSIPPAEGDDRGILTNRQGHPVYDNQNQRTVGERGPATLENDQFSRRSPSSTASGSPSGWCHARGTTAFGYFEAYGSFGDELISKYTARRSSRSGASARTSRSASPPWPAAATPPRRPATRAASR